MTSLLLRLLVSAAALWVATKVVDGIRYLAPDYLPLLGVALVFGAVNSVVKPIVSLLALPFTLLTLGLFLLVVNGAMLLLTAAVSTRLGLGFEVDGLGAAMLGSIVVSVATWVLGAFLPDRDRDDD
jgi:putative membrane protein